MKFKSITMENFMRYKGVNTIEFSCDPGKNVTVVLGDNTVGKTTIAQAFRFGLYGAVNMEKWKNADDYQLLIMMFWRSWMQTVRQRYPLRLWLPMRKSSIRSAGKQFTAEIIHR